MSDQYIDELKYQIESLNAENKMLRDIIQKNKEQQNVFSKFDCDYGVRSILEEYFSGVASIPIAEAHLVYNKKKFDSIKIFCIKSVMAQTKCSLKEAKEYVRLRTGEQ